MKIQMESLLNGKTIEVNFDEQIVFSHLAQDESGFGRYDVMMSRKSGKKQKYRQLYWSLR